MGSIHKHARSPEEYSDRLLGLMSRRIFPEAHVSWRPRRDDLSTSQCFL